MFAFKSRGGVVSALQNRSESLLNNIHVDLNRHVFKVLNMFDREVQTPGDNKMRKLAIGLVVVALAVIGSIEATAGDAGTDPASQPVGVRFVMGPDCGFLEIANGAGLDMEAHDFTGTPVMGGVVYSTYTADQLPPVPVMPDGSALHVRVGDKIFRCSTTEPEWIWD